MFPSRRHILNLISDFLALRRAAQPAKIEAQRTYFKRHGMVISLDGMEPEQGNEMLFLVREANLDLTLVAETLYSSRADLIRRQVKPEDFKQARQALRKVETRLKKLYRFRHHPDEYYRDLEIRWEKAILSSG